VDHGSYVVREKSWRVLPPTRWVSSPISNLRLQVRLPHKSLKFRGLFPNVGKAIVPQGLGLVSAEDA
jgi:hypothetical protein